MRLVELRNEASSNVRLAGSIQRAMKLPNWVLSSVVPVAVCLTVWPGSAWAQDHVVPLEELHEKARATSQERAKNIADIERVLSYPAAAQALQKANVNPEQMRTAVATLSDDELARLSDRARASEKDVQGGLIVGILALIGLIVVILIVIAVVG
jgi:hypothetical protein